MGRSLVLDVGNCGFDHATIRNLIESNFDAAVEQVDTADDAIRKLESNNYDLMLVNRVFDRDQGDGLKLIEQIKGHGDSSTVPVMLISNFSQHQQTAEDLGAVPGFGKATLHADETKQRLAKFLS